MHSLRSKITLMTVSAIIVAMTIATVFSVVSIRNFGNRTSNEILFLMCGDGQKNLDTYFNSIVQSVETVKGYAEADLKDTEIENLGSHIKRVESIFEKTANNTSGILTYYYRIDPEVSTSDKGFWYVNLDGKGFTEHEVTDITLYDTSNQSELVWFTVPKFKGSSVWLPPYVTDNLDVYVLSYNVPLKKDGRFIGVIGIEIDYETIAKTVKDISIYNNGYAFINDSEGKIIYHPRMDIKSYTGDSKILVPNGLLSEDTYIKYSYDGVKKQAVWLPLSNGMRLNVTVPISEINMEWYKLTSRMIIVFVILLIFVVIFTLRFSQRITKPLRRLTYAALQVDAGNYDLKLDYNGNDEVGVLTNTFNQLVTHLKKYIKDLNDLAYSDPLTSVKNKGAFNIYVSDIQKSIDKNEKKKFAIGIFDCNDLKYINDKFGHKKGDIYLQKSVSLICNVFRHSPVFRMGGDEFAVILQSADYKDRNKLINTFEEKVRKSSYSSSERWKQVSIAMGVAVYNPKNDKSVESVIRRADKLMYEDKHRQKKERKHI